MAKHGGGQIAAFTNATLSGEIQATLLANGKILLTAYKDDGTGIGLVTATINGNNTLTFSSITFLAPQFSRYVYTSGPVLMLKNGSLVMPIWGENTGDTYNSSAVIISNNNGSTWGSKITVASGIGEASGFTETGLMQMTNGDIVAILRASNLSGESYGKYYRSISTTNGLAWTTPTVSLDITRVGRPSLARTASNGLFLVCRGNVFIPFLNARNVYQTSWDEGVTWSPPLAIDYRPETGFFLVDNYDALTIQSGSIGLVSNIHTEYISPPSQQYQVKYFEFSDE